jgi:hypothetical protein
VTLPLRGTRGIPLIVPLGAESDWGRLYQGRVRDDLPTSSWPCSSRPSTSLLRLTFLGVDARDKRGHDESLIVSLGIIQLRC